MSTRISGKCHKKVKMSDFEERGISETKTDRSSKLGSSPFWSQRYFVTFELDLLHFEPSVTRPGSGEPLQWQREGTIHRSGRVELPEQRRCMWRLAAQIKS